MNYWLLKTEPEDYSFDDLLREKRATWDGVRNHQALGFMRNMKKGDQVMIYHTGKERAIAGFAQVVRDAYPDPNQDDPKIVVIDIRAKKRLPVPVTFKEVKSDHDFADFLLVRNSRLSVMPVEKEIWEKLQVMGSAK